MAVAVTAGGRGPDLPRLRIHHGLDGASAFIPHGCRLCRRGQRCFAFIPHGCWLCLPGQCCSSAFTAPHCRLCLPGECFSAFIPHHCRLCLCGNAALLSSLITAGSFHQLLLSALSLDCFWGGAIWTAVIWKKRLVVLIPGR